MSAITIGGDLIHYEVLGRGRPVILLHGWLGSWRYWVPTMQQLQTKYRVYALDLRGFGDSGKNPQKYTLDHQVQLVFDFMRELGLPKAAFIGHGLGALVASEFARLYGDKVPRMLLVSAPLFDPGGLDTRIPAGRLVPLTDNKPQPPSGDAVKPLAPEATIMNAGTAMRAALQEAARARTSYTEPPKPTDPTLLKPTLPLPDLNERKDARHNPLTEMLDAALENLLAKCFRRTEPEYEKLSVDLAKIDAAAIKQSITDFDSGRMLDRIRLLPMPMVIMHGMDDQLIQQPNENVWNYLTKDREDSLRPVLLRSVRHFPMLENESFLRITNEFLDIADVSKMESDKQERWKRRTR
jgi:pimeloyl-ACP methyl ester carboxylesterase